MSSENTVLEQQNTPQTAPTTENTQPASTSLLQTETAPAAAEDKTAQTERPNWLPDKFKSAEDLAKSYVELEKTLADKAPKVPEQYDFSYTKDFGLADLDGELKQEVTEAFKHARLTDQQAKEVMALYSDQVGKLTDQLMNAPRTDLVQEQTSLQTVWKDSYADNIKAVRQFADTLPKRMLELPLVDTAEGIQFLHQLMQQNIQNPIVTNQSQSANVVSIREQINDMRKDDRYKLPQGDPVGEAHRQKLYNLYEQLDRVRK
jgi:bacterioferritin (cytochrome b1)